MLISDWSSDVCSSDLGQRFKGCYDLLRDQLILVARGNHDRPAAGIQCRGLDDPKLDELLPAELVRELREQVEMVRGLCPRFDLEAFRNGTMTPVFFGRDRKSNRLNSSP